MNKRGYVYSVFTVVVTLLLIVGCGGNKSLSANEKFKGIADLTSGEMAVLSQKSFYFAHQSVGVDIVDGLKMIMADYPALKLNLAVTEDSSMVQPGAFLHSRVGKNRKPETKISAFENVLDRGMGNQVDVAFLKFCYVDANQSVSAEKIFEDYKNSIEALKTKYPKTTFIHFTMPLKSVPGGWKAKIKNVIGKEISVQVDNAVRGEYNNLLRERYANKEPLFDIARLESVALGSRKIYGFNHNGNRYEALAPENTSDGGHLSDVGKRWVAEQLVVFLANIEYKP